MQNHQGNSEWSKVTEVTLQINIGMTELKWIKTTVYDKQNKN